MTGVNRAILIGNVGGDPDIRDTNNGGRLASFSLATNETWRDRQSGERRERVEWHRVVVFQDGLVGIVQQYVRKGSKLYIEGAIRSREYRDSGGIDRKTIEIVLQGFHCKLEMLDRAQSGSRPPPPADEEAYGTAPAAASSAERTRAVDPDLDDEIPF